MFSEICQLENKHENGGEINNCEYVLRIITEIIKFVPAESDGVETLPSLSFFSSVVF